MTRAANLAEAAGSGFAFRNRIINGDMRIDQRNAGALHTLSGSATYYLDRWYALSAGANATAQRVAGTTSQNIYRFNGAAGVTGIYMGQKIESSNVYDLAGGTATLSVDLSNNLLTTVSWNAYYANSADNFSGLTYITGGDITVSATASRYSVQIALPAGAANGIRIEFGVGAQTSGKWTIGNVQLEKGTVATPFEFRPYGAELALCQRYYEKSYDQSVVPGTASSYSGGVEWVANTTDTNWLGGCRFSVVKRATPTVSIYSCDSGSANVVNRYAGSAAINVSSVDNAGQSGFMRLILASIPATAPYRYQFVAVSEL